MSETQTPQEAATDWNQLRNAPATSVGNTAWTAQHYTSLVDLIKHCDNQISTTHLHHMVAVGSMIPILAILMTIGVPWYTHVGLLVLGAALSIRWFGQTSKLNLEKLCWVSLARRVEQVCLTELPGPFTAQEHFFASISAPMSSSDRFLMNKLGTRRIGYISVIVLAFGLAALGLVAVMSSFGWPIK